MTKTQAVKALKDAGFTEAAGVLKSVWEKLEATKAPPADWPLGEAIGDYTDGTGGVVSGKTAKQIKDDLGLLVAEKAQKWGKSKADAWKRIRPLWQAFSASKDGKMGPALFAKAPLSYAPTGGLAAIGTPLPSVARPSPEDSAKKRAEIFAMVGKTVPEV